MTTDAKKLVTELTALSLLRKGESASPSQMTVRRVKTDHFAPCFLLLASCFLLLASCFLDVSIHIK
ncbi:hypothetical protein YSA_06531 [Pseudomonas putida ND6]|uniref:Transmembrane protein n=1 Tax=Pseudomonas putida ND6 TaxID=231023 RepID=I3UXR9_PSEPU|nr:hypothetical protein YSA_06531 [Pseudomonas putida ND6]